MVAPVPDLGGPELELEPGPACLACLAPMAMEREIYRIAATCLAPPPHPPYSNNNNIIVSERASHYHRLL